jgi:hypothetical protein
MDFAIDKFHPDRLGKITGSPCHVMFPEKGDGKKGMTTYAKHLAKEQYFQFYDEKKTWQMAHGDMGESFGIAHIQRYYDKKAEQGWFEQKDGVFGGTADGLAPDWGFDIKCPTTMDTWLDYMYDGVSKQQYHQCQMYMYLFNKPKWVIAAYLLETDFMNDNGLTYPIRDADRMILVEVDVEIGWVDKLKESAKFVIETRDGYVELLKSKFPKDEIK